MSNRHGIGKARNSALLIALLIGVGSCCYLWPWDVGFAYEDDLVGDYAVRAVDSLENATIVRKRSPHGGVYVVGPGVSVYGWNDDFVIAKTDFRSWFIVEVASGKAHGPLAEQEYYRLRMSLGVPPALDFTRNVFSK